MTPTSELAFITPTWAGDLDHFRVMRASLERSPLGAYPHYVVVQAEDLELFDEFRSRPGLILLSTRDVLPGNVERRRMTARRWSDWLGRNATRICGSLRRKIGWPKWPSYTGWHTQQLCKLKLASELNCDTAVVIDSDVVVTPHAEATDFFDEAGVVCFAHWQPRQALKGKVKNWVAESEQLVGAAVASDPVNAYFDTPFILNRALLSNALQQLEQSSGTHWWQAFLDRPPRRWSEFGFYKAFLNSLSSYQVVWREPAFCRYLFDTRNPQSVVEQVNFLLSEPDVHFITIHSQAAGRHQWPAEKFLTPILANLSKGDNRRSA